MSGAQEFARCPSAETTGAYHNEIKYSLGHRELRQSFRNFIEASCPRLLCASRDAIREIFLRHDESCHAALLDELDRDKSIAGTIHPIDR
jgi:hypothetical protein